MYIKYQKAEMVMKCRGKFTWTIQVVHVDNIHKTTITECFEISCIQKKMIDFSLGIL